MDNSIKISWTRNRINKVFKFIKLLRVEPYIFMLAFQWGLKGMAGGQLVEDKICMHWFNTTAQYCHDLPSLDEEGDYDKNDGIHLGFKSRILSESAVFGTYGTYIGTGPTIIWALFAGAWIDRYIKGRKILMLMGVCASIIENIVSIYLTVQWNTSVYYNLINTIPSAILAGGSGVRVATTHYTTATTPPKLLAMRFMVMEMVWLTALPIGQSLGGFILVKKPTFHTGEIRNYTVIYLIALVFEVVAFLWIIIMIKENVARKHEMKAEMKIQGIRGKPGKGTKIQLRSDMSREDKNIHPMKLLFDLENVKSMVRTAIKKRPNKARMQIYFMFTSMFVYLMHISGGGVVGNQFGQEVYLWDPDWSSYMGSISLVVHGIATIIFVPILIKVLKVNDIPLAIIGFIMLFAIDIIKGSWLTPLAYYISIPAGATAGLAVVGTKSHLTKIVGRDEIGKILSFMATLDTLAPIISSSILVIIFKYTIDDFPGTVYQIISLIILIPILMMMWIDLFTVMPLVEQNRGCEISCHDQNQNDIKDNDKEKQRYPRHRRPVRIENSRDEQINYITTNKLDNEVNELKLDQNSNETSF